MGFLSDLISVGSSLLGGLFGGGGGGGGSKGGGGGGLFGGLFGGGGGDGGGIFSLGLDIFGDSGEGGGLFDSPILGNILGAVGGVLMEPDPKEEARAVYEARQEVMREGYGLPSKPGAYKPIYTPARGLAAAGPRGSAQYA